MPSHWLLQPHLVNGLTGFTVLDQQQLVAVGSVTVHNRRVVRVDLVRAPSKLARATGLTPGPMQNTATARGYRKSTGLSDGIGIGHGA